MADHQRADRLIAEIAAGQFGVVSGRQMRWAGLSRRTVGRRLGAARIFRVGWTCYSFVPRVDPLGTARAALLGAGADRHLDTAPRPSDVRDAVRTATRLDGTVLLSHWASLRLQRVADTPATPVDVTFVAGRRRPRADGVRGHSARSIDPADVVRVAGMPTTTVARALVDVAPRTPAARLVRLVREAQFLGLLPAEGLAATCARARWHPGVAALARADPDLAIRVDGDSPLAGDLAVFLEHETALGPWSAQHPVAVRGRTYRLDHALPDLEIAAEADGAGAHEQSQGRTTDGRRDATLLARGWLTVRVTASRLAHDSNDLRETLHALAIGRGWPGPPAGWLPRSARLPRR